MKKNVIILIVIIFVVVEFFIAIAPGEMKFVDTNPKPTIALKSNSSKLKIVDITPGTGKAVKAGDTAVLHYKGMFADGKEFESSYTLNKPIEITIGTGQVIKGWDEGIPGMKVGGKRRLVIPPSLAYGDKGSPPKIAPNTTLTFEVELLSIK